MSIDFINKPGNAALSNLGDSSRTQRNQSTETNSSLFIQESSYDDSVSVTNDARLLHRAATVADTVPAFDSQRVQSLRVEVAKGTWSFDSARVAEKFMRFEQSLRP